MKRVLVVILGIILSTLLVSVSLAGKGYYAVVQQPQALEQGSDADTQQTEEQVYDADVQQAEAQEQVYEADDQQPQEQEQATDLTRKGYDAAVRQQPQEQEQGAYKEGEMRSWVSQTQIDTIVKREEAAAQRDEKLRIRAKNIQSTENVTDINKLFRSSK